MQLGRIVYKTLYSQVKSIALQHNISNILQSHKDNSTFAPIIKINRQGRRPRCHYYIFFLLLKFINGIFSNSVKCVTFTVAEKKENSGINKSLLVHFFLTITKKKNKFEQIFFEKIQRLKGK